MSEKYSAYQKQVRDFENLSATVAEAEIKTRREEIVRLEEEIRKFSDDAEKIFMQKQEELMRPILLKIDRSINEVATEHNYSIIVNTELSAGQRLILFGTQTYDVSDLVLKKMGHTVNQNKR
ncbi:MAG: OmpH family outer membrane protein [Chryseolinea sp.]